MDEKKDDAGSIPLLNPEGRDKNDGEETLEGESRKGGRRKPVS